MRYRVIASRDGETFVDHVNADSQEAAEAAGRSLIAGVYTSIPFHPVDEAEDFEAELDGFAVDPDPDPTVLVAEVFALAKDAPTSFEDEQWLEGFEDARCIIAARLAAELESAGVIESASTFLDACDIPEDDNKCGQCEGTGRTQSASNLEDEECPVCDGSGTIEKEVE